MTKSASTPQSAVDEQAHKDRLLVHLIDRDSDEEINVIVEKIVHAEAQSGQEMPYVVRLHPIGCFGDSRLDQPVFTITCVLRSGGALRRGARLCLSKAWFVASTPLNGALRGVRAVKVAAHMLTRHWVMNNSG